MDPEEQMMMGGAPMGAAPMGAPMGGPAEEQSPAAQLLPIVAMLAQQQQQALMVQQQQEEMLRQAMQDQLLRLISMMPTANPAGVAARTEPMPMNVSPEDAEGAGDMSMGGEDEMMEDEAEMEMEY